MRQIVVEEIGEAVFSITCELCGWVGWSAWGIENAGQIAEDHAAKCNALHGHLGEPLKRLSVGSHFRTPAGHRSSPSKTGRETPSEPTRNSKRHGKR